MNSENIRALSLRAKQFADRNLNEAQTKTALVQPFIEALGYDVSNPFEVSAEYTADQGTKRGEKIDYAILNDNTPIVLIECKPCMDCLDEGRCSQLRRYFQAVPQAKIGILTNGTRYLFFSDRKRENIMDDKPFMEVDLLAFNEQLLPEIQCLSKESLDMDGLLHSADALQYFNEMMHVFAKEIESPTDDFVRFFASKVYNRKIMAKTLDFFRPIFLQVIDGYLSARLNQRLEDSKRTPKVVNLEKSENNSIITTNTEMWGLVIVRTLLHDIIDVSRVNMRDQKSYCSILLDANNRKTICRFFNFTEWKENDPNIGDNAHVVIFNGREGGERFPLQYIDDLYPLKEHLIAAVRKIG